MKNRHYTRSYGVKRAWIGYYGHLPSKGLEIHHIDGNPYNNAKNNLVALSRKEHMRQHRVLKIRRNFRQIENKLKIMERERLEHLKKLALQNEGIQNHFDLLECIDKF